MGHQEIVGVFVGGSRAPYLVELMWPFFSDDLRVLAPYVDVCSRAS
jgi:hypothetical protein